jgi:hypothetical protein
MHDLNSIVKVFPMQRLCIKKHGPEAAWRGLKAIALTVLLFLFFPLFCTAVQAQEKRYDVPIGDSPSLGPKDAPVTIIEFLVFH